MNLTIRPINTGFVTTIPKQYMFHYSTHKYLKNIPDERIEMPCFAFLIEGAKETILVDTGMAWTERASKYHHPGSRQPEGMAIFEQLKKIGYEPEDIDIIIFTHLHWDHVYYMNKFINAEYIVHEKELAFAKKPIPLYFKSYENKAIGLEDQFSGIKFKTVNGNQEIVPGVSVFEAFGHSPGHQCVQVSTSKGDFICCGDAIFTLKNLDPIPEISYDITPPGRFANIIDSWNSILEIKKRVKNSSFVLPCHEISLLAKIKQTPVLGI